MLQCSIYSTRTVYCNIEIHYLAYTIQKPAMHKTQVAIFAPGA